MAKNLMSVLTNHVFQLFSSHFLFLELSQVSGKLSLGGGLFLGGSPSTGTDGHRQTGGHRFPSTTQYREPTDRSPGPRQGILFRFTPWIFPLTASVPRSPSLGFIPLSSLLPQLCALWSGWPVPQDNWTATTHQRIPSHVSLSQLLLQRPQSRPLGVRFRIPGSQALERQA